MSAHETLQLQPNRPLRLDAARHAELRVDSGTVWITASGMAGDLFLSAGQSYCVPGEGLALVEAVPWGQLSVTRFSSSALTGPV